MIATVRAFNRTVTERVGALQDRYLARDRSLSEARVLWEIGEDGLDVRDLRARLALDSGYSSRLLRSLESAKMITVTPGRSDRRVRTARLTKKGRAERAVLDRRSDDLARSILDPLRPNERERLVSAMSEVVRLVNAAMVEIHPVEPGGDAAQYCLREYFAELDRRFESGFDPARSRPARADEMRPPSGVFLVAFLRGEPLGCGGLKFHGDGPAEVKRMWVAPRARGLGLGRRLLEELESRAVEQEKRTVRLDTNKALTEAISLYRAAGYREVLSYNDEPYGDHWFEKDLATNPRS